MTEKGGKKKKTKADGQLRPLIVSAARSRVTEEVTMSAATSRDLARYVRWAAKEARLTQDEAMTLTLDRAIGDLFKRDEAWQQARVVDGSDPPSVGTAAAQPSAHPGNGAVAVSGSRAP
jgi:hypothetical protein